MWKNIGAAMSLDKITFRGVETVQNQPEIKKEEPQKSPFDGSFLRFCLLFFPLFPAS